VVAEGPAVGEATLQSLYTVPIYVYRRVRKEGEMIIMMQPVS